MSFSGWRHGWAMERHRYSERPGREGSPPFPDWLIRDLRSDHAGEMGAIGIYNGILAVARDPEVRHFAASHLKTERGHLEMIEDLLPVSERSRLLPFWRAAGFMTGLLPALFGKRPVYATVEAVETFVDAHYAAQIERLTEMKLHAGVRSVLERCNRDEIRHRDEARGRWDQQPGHLLRLWCWLVGAGSKAAVRLVRVI